MPKSMEFLRQLHRILIRVDQMVLNLFQIARRISSFSLAAALISFRLTYQRCTLPSVPVPNGSHNSSRIHHFFRYCPADTGS